MDSDSDQHDATAPDPLANADDVLRPHDEPMLFCPVCSSRLVALKCKLICERCGYYMSCADYY